MADFVRLVPCVAAWALISDRPGWREWALPLLAAARGSTARGQMLTAAFRTALLRTGRTAQRPAHRSE